MVPDFKIRRAMVKMQFKRANEQLVKATNAGLFSDNIEQLKQTLEKEYEDFKVLLNEWTDLQTGKYQQTRKSLQEKWQGAAIHARFIELENGLKLQHERLQVFNAQFAFAKA